GRGGAGGTLDFSQLGVTGTAFPFIQWVGQDETERLLLNRLTERACPVVWETRLDALRLDDRGATATLVHDGKRQDWRCAWVIGADGQYSAVRRQLNIPLEGDDRVRNFFVADLETEQADSRKIKLVLHDNSTLAAVPFDLGDRYRIIGQ